MFHLYGLLIAAGCLLGLWVSQKCQGKLIKHNPDYQKIDLDHALIWILIPAVVGARLYHVIDLWEYYSLNPVAIWQVWQGGLGIYGALAGGIVGLYLYCRRSQTPFLPALDIIALSLPIAQAVGRLGNYFNQELFGLPTNLPWGILVPVSLRPQAYAHFSHFHPLFAYEAILNLCLAGLLIYLVKFKLRRGSYFSVYLIGYGLIRFGLEFLRIDPWTLGILTTAQLFSLLVVVIGFIIMAARV